MSFVGELEHLPIVDVIQLLNSTRKSGTLCVKSSKGETQLVFADGYIVGANHVNNSVRVGQILVEMNAITREELEIALTEQFNAGSNRKPLVATLIESGRIERDIAYKGLESLIEMTIVEVLTWTSGTFELDINKITVSDEYRYFPEKLKQDICLNTQSVLMDALRIYDEKMRDGTLSNEPFDDEDDISMEGFDASWESPATSTITVDDLGLADLDSLEKKIPEIFTGIRQVDPSETHRKQIRNELPQMRPEEQERIVSFLTEFSESGKDATLSNGPSLAVILLSRDELVRHAVTTVCRHDGHTIFITDEPDTLDHMIDKAISRDLVPVLMIDPWEASSGKYSTEGFPELVNREQEKYHLIHMILLAAPEDSQFAMKAIQGGVRLILPKPCDESRKDAAADDIVDFVKTFRAYLLNTFYGYERKTFRLFCDSMKELGSMTDPPEISFAVLRFAAALFERVITFVASGSELVAERGTGIERHREGGTAAPLRFRIPIDRPSIFSRIVETGEMLFAESSDKALLDTVYREIGAPVSAKTALVPIRSAGRVIAVIYGDFGTKSASSIPIDLLEILAAHASLVIENAAFRKKFEKTKKPA